LNKVLAGVITVTFSVNLLSVVKIIRLIERTDLFKIGYLFLGGKEFVTILYSRLETKRQTTSGTRAGVGLSCDKRNGVT